MKRPKNTASLVKKARIAYYKSLLIRVDDTISELKLLLEQCIKVSDLIPEDPSAIVNKINTAKNQLKDIIKQYNINNFKRNKL